MPDLSLLKKLCAANSISGDENSVRNIILDEIRPYTDEIQIDPLGNVLVHKRGKNRAKAGLMLSAHMDEVGLMITDITSDGYLMFDEVGGIDRRVVLGKNVLVAGKVNGVIGIKPVHLTKGDQSSAIPEYSDMYIDIGASSKEEALKYVSYGDSVYFDSEFTQTDTMIQSKAIDDRFGCLVLINLIKSDLMYDTDFAFVVQEEIGLNGATAAAYTLNPEFALVIETTTAADIPEIEETGQVCSLGAGAVISVMDRRTRYDQRMVDYAFETAERLGVKAQYKRAVAGGNDAGAIHKSRGGVRTLAISLACRYLHSPSCVASKSDCEDILTLTKELSQNIAEGRLCNDNLG
ncbi:MAG TPA: cellulase [Ruminococcaceae bacterium]|nr:cellulase [Oscillospiraceae bacterium]